MNGRLGYKDKNGILRDIELYMLSKDSSINNLYSIIEYTLTYENEFSIINALKEKNLIPDDVDKLYYLVYEDNKYVSLNNGDIIYTSEYKDFFSINYVKKYLIENIYDNNFRNLLFGEILSNSKAMITIYNSFNKLNKRKDYFDQVTHDLINSDFDSELDKSIDTFIKNENKFIKDKSKKYNYDFIKSNLLNRLKHLTMTDKEKLYNYFKLIYEENEINPLFVDNMFQMEHYIQEPDVYKYESAEVLCLIQELLYCKNDLGKFELDENGKIKINKELLIMFSLLIQRYEINKSEKITK